jgi:3-hydroxy-5-methyl-1-naphthoate 3-O-methyltransferase
MNAPGAGATPERITPERLLQLAWGFAPPLIVGAAVQHRVFDLLEQEPKTAEQVAVESGASLRGIRAIMNALIGLQLLTKDGAGRYSLTPESAAFLVRGKPQFLGALLGDSRRLREWLDISEVVRAGKPAAAVNQEQHGVEYFKGFVETLFGTNYAAAQALAETLGIAQTEQPVRVLDLAAGSGVWGIALAQKSPRVSVTAVDWPGVLEVTKRIAERSGLLDRFQFVAGDLLSADFGRGHNIATLGHILHTEGATRSQALLKKTFAALDPGGTIAIADFLVNEDRTGPPMSLIFAVNMLVHTEEGDAFSFGEISGWLRDAGFENPRPVDSPGPSPLILANKPE